MENCGWRCQCEVSVRVPKRTHIAYGMNDMHSIEHEIQYKNPLYFEVECAIIQQWKWTQFTHTERETQRSTQILYSCWKYDCFQWNDGSFDTRNGKYTVIQAHFTIYLLKKTQCLNGITANKFEIIVGFWIFFLTLESGTTIVQCLKMYLKCIVLSMISLILC